MSSLRTPVSWSAVALATVPLLASSLAVPAVAQVAPGYSYTALVNFPNGSSGGPYDPEAGVVFGYDGNLYGTTYSGGPGPSNDEQHPGGGTLYSYNLKTNTYTNLVNFNTAGVGGYHPLGELAVGPDGGIYGVTAQGGGRGLGTLFRYDPIAASYTTIVDFGTPVAPGTSPGAGVTFDGFNLYGTTSQSGGFSSGGGTLYRYNILSHNFATLMNFVGNDVGGSPRSNLTLTSTGDIYGTVYSGAAEGALFRYSLSNNVYEIIHRFPNAQYAGVTFGKDGNLYGAESAGDNYSGSIYRYNTFTGDFTTLNGLSSAGLNGAGPLSPLTLASDGSFYGTTYTSKYGRGGTVFRYDPASNTLSSVLESASFYRNGLTIGSDGSIYGTETAGGANGGGTLFRLTATGAAAPEPGSIALLLSVSVPAAGFLRNRRKKASATA